jgi:hypothetical protein
MIKNLKFVSGLCLLAGLCAAKQRVCAVERMDVSVIMIRSVGCPGKKVGDKDEEKILSGIVTVEEINLWAYFVESELGTPPDDVRCIGRATPAPCAVPAVPVPWANREVSITLPTKAALSKNALPSPKRHKPSYDVFLQPAAHPPEGCSTPVDASLLLKYNDR